MDRSVWQIPIILPTKTERRIIPSAQPVMCGQSAVSDAAVKRYFAPEKEASLLLCEEHHREQWRLFELARKKAFSLLLSSHIRYTRCSDIER